MLMVGGAITVSVSLAVPPVPPSVEVTVPVVLTCAPALIPVTLTENVHEPLEASVPPDKLTVEGDPGGLLIVAVIVPLPQEPVTVVEANFTPPGKVSVKLTPLSDTLLFGLVSVKLNVLLPFSGMVLGLNDLLMVGGLATVSVAVAAAPLPPSVELIAPVLFR